MFTISIMNVNFLKKYILVKQNYDGGYLISIRLVLLMKVAVV